MIHVGGTLTQKKKKRRRVGAFLLIESDNFRHWRIPPTGEAYVLRVQDKKGKKRFKTKRHKFCKNDAGWWGFEITSFALLNNLLPIEWRDWGVVQLYPNRQHRSSIQRGKHEGVNPNSQKVYESQRNPARRHFFPHEIFTSRYRQRKVFY